MWFSPFSSPELQSLPPRERRRMIGAWMNANTLTRSIQVALVLFIVLGMIGSLGMFYVGKMELDERGVMTMTIILGGALIVIGLASFLRYLRSDLADFVRRKLPELDRSICLACGYDLRGNLEGPCPECGYLRKK